MISQEWSGREKLSQKSKPIPKRGTLLNHLPGLIVGADLCIQPLEDVSIPSQWTLAVLDGKGCLKELLKIDDKARILVASGSSADSTIKECFEIGAKGFVAKPFRMRELLREGRKILNEG